MLISVTLLMRPLVSLLFVVRMSILLSFVRPLSREDDISRRRTILELHR
jgi:hypothetical protein